MTAEAQRHRGQKKKKEKEKRITTEAQRHRGQKKKKKKKKRTTAEPQRHRGQKKKNLSRGIKGLRGLKKQMVSASVCFYLFLNPCNPEIHVIPIESFFCFFFF